MKITETSGSCCSCSSTSGDQTCGCSWNCCQNTSIQTTTSRIIFADRLDHLLARLG